MLVVTLLRLHLHLHLLTTLLHLHLHLHLLLLLLLCLLLWLLSRLVPNGVLLSSCPKVQTLIRLARGGFGALPLQIERGHVGAQACCVPLRSSQTVH